MVLTKEEAQGILWDDKGKIVEDTIVENSRWSIIHEMVFEWEDGNFYRTCYSVGATETQDESPFEYEDEIKCERVQKVSKLVEVWEEWKEPEKIEPEEMNQDEYMDQWEEDNPDASYEDYRAAQRGEFLL